MGLVSSCLWLNAAQENKEVYEGEVTELMPEETESAVRPDAAAFPGRLTEGAIR